MDEDEKWIRTRKAAKHMLAAIVFNESSTASLHMTEGSLLACMGYYYVAFHAAIAILWICPSVSKEELCRIRHSRLRALIEQNLVQKKGMLDRSFLIEYQQLQDFREYANYYFGSKAPKYEYTQIAPGMSTLTDSILSKAIEVLFKELTELDMVFAFQSTIGDDIGSDLLRLHAGTSVAEKIWAYLVANGLTT